VLRKRFSDPVIEQLLAIAWWDWPHARIGTAMNDFRSLGPEAFCAKYAAC
jgi:hypothetical protein